VGGTARRLGKPSIPNLQSDDWIVDFEKRIIEVYLPCGQTLELHSLLTEQDEITSSVLAGYRCKVETIFSI